MVVHMLCMLADIKRMITGSICMHSSAHGTSCGCAHCTCCVLFALAGYAETVLFESKNPEKAMEPAYKRRTGDALFIRGLIWVLTILAGVF